jgi:hypothetical protein
MISHSSQQRKLCLHSGQVENLKEVKPLPDQGGKFLFTSKFYAMPLFVNNRPLFSIVLEFVCGCQPDAFKV